MSKSPDAKLIKLAKQIVTDQQVEADEWAKLEAAGYGDMEEWPPLAKVFRRQQRTVAALRQSRATTLEGILAKMAALAWCQTNTLYTAADLTFPQPPGGNVQVMTSIINDLAAMQPELWKGDAR